MGRRPACWRGLGSVGTPGYIADDLLGRRLGVQDRSWAAKSILAAGDGRIGNGFGKDEGGRLAGGLAVAIGGARLGSLREEESWVDILEITNVKDVSDLALARRLEWDSCNLVSNEN